MNTPDELNVVRKLYSNQDYPKTRSLWSLITNAYRMINSVYIFTNFDEYCRQLRSDKQEDKQKVYWKASYYEKLIDYIKIITAFETLNKAVLIKRGILIHKIDRTFNKELFKQQSAGKPVKISDFYQDGYPDIPIRGNRTECNGLAKSMATINFSHTLNEEYQSILNLDKKLVYYLKEINLKRNRLHLYTDFHGAFHVEHHIEKWRFIKDTSISVIKKEKDKIDEELKKIK
ncbi:hypothetical protein LS482_08745 [Sinomicrobium kalidii]|uniref:hypothetical protein n=1 Tax=Sinomicrobium kalidii TaxID=2900738 RepID=UPI001E371E58|nr:hypothetical protein [Sinomicrobium kalidii]UGU17955.1 hypothetical protein LS482_08745 [Sinomicrobium kalidii]